MAKDIYKKDLYAILGVQEDATDKQIVKAYRKTALTCHPDKNPDNPKATQMFLELSQVLAILTDVVARAAYDQSRKAKKAVEERNKFLDVKRKKFKDDLEARERALAEHNLKERTEESEKKLQKEVERLRREGSKLLEQEQERLKQHLKHPTFDYDDDIIEQTHEAEISRIKLKWKAQKTDAQNGGYSAHVLRNILSCYGHINTLIVSRNRNGSAIVEFEKSGVTADILDETGLQANPFSIVWLSGKPLNHKDETFSTVEGYSNGGFMTAPPLSNNVSVGDHSGRKSEMYSTGGTMFDNSQRCTSHSSETSVVNDRNYESLVLMKMRQAEERKRLIEQMKKEDEDDG